jgi:subtilisin family serine protease
MIDLPGTRTLRFMSIATLIVAASANPALAWINDRDANKIDDRIERVNERGYAAAFVNDDRHGRMMFGVTDGATLAYAVRVRYDHVPSAADASALGALGVPWTRPYLYIPYIRTEASWAQILGVVALPGVTRVEVVPVLYPTNHIGSRVVRARDSRGYTKDQNDVLFPSARGDLGLDGSGVVIAIFDTGVNDAPDVATSYPGHESLAGKFLGGGEFFYGNPVQNTANTASMNPQDHGAAASEYHATHVAGIAMGTGGPGGTFAGVAPKARLVDCKVLSDAGASVSGVPEAVEWCLFNRGNAWGLTGADSIYRGVDVINMSLGDVLSSDGTEADAIAVNTAVRGGIAVVCASGNLGLTEWVASPSSADSSICVGATTHSKTLDRSDDKVTSFSQEGARADDGDGEHRDEMKPNLVAPGNGIISADGDPATDGTEYKALSGTSMASPHVAGCVALILQANPALTPLEVRTILENTAEHNVGNEKGDRPNDPFGIDPNYDPGCGWGLVDVYAGAREALNATSGVQVTQTKKPRPRPADHAIDVGWITQREHPFLGFEVQRAPDVNGAPGAFARINAALVTPAGDPAIEADDNRTGYAYVDDDAALVLGQRYWYRVAWVDLSSVAHAEPGLPVDFGEAPRVATAYYAITHDSPDSDLDIKVGASLTYDATAPTYSILGPGAGSQDSAQIANIDFIYVPPGHLRHFWSVPFTVNDGVGALLPPGYSQPWFLDVTEGGFADQSGRVESFSMFVNDAPGGASGVTYTTDSPTPQQTVEGTRVTLWIPERPAAAVEVASFAAAAEPGGVRLRLALVSSGAARVTLFRSSSSDFATRQWIAGPLAIERGAIEFVDVTAESGVTYFYWAIVDEATGASLVSGPVAASLTSPLAATFLAAPRPNPAFHGTALTYAIGAEATSGGRVPVTLAIRDAQGRAIRELVQGHLRAGEYHVAWDGRDGTGAPARPGIYFVTLHAGSTTRAARICVVR